MNDKMFPADGLWIVRRDGDSAENIARLCDLKYLNAPSVAEMSLHKDDAVAAVRELQINKCFSINELVQTVIHEIGKHHVSQTDFLTELIIEEL